jgi:branched-chain amino acid aminotransferase
MAKTFPYAFIEGKTCKTEKALIPISSKVVQYGIGYFTGIRGFWNEEKKNLYIFRLEDHYERLQESALITGMKFNWSYEKFKDTVAALIKKNKAKEDIYLRVTVYSGSTQLTPRFDNTGDDVAIYMISLKDYFSGAAGLSVCVSSWRRFDDDAISVKAKITGSYCNSALAKTEAIQNGYDEPIFLNRDGKVCEASGANLFGVKDGEIFTPPLSANNLNGITRRSLIHLAKTELNLPVHEENIDRSTLYTFNELFFTGTAAKITKISKVDKRKIGTGRTPTLKKLQKIYEKVVTNSHPHYEHWSTPVY